MVRFRSTIIIFTCRLDSSAIVKLLNYGKTKIERECNLTSGENGEQGEGVQSV